MIMKKILFLLTMVVFASAKSQDTCITDARTYTNTNITQNGVRAITAQKLNTSLNKIIDAIECVEGGVFVSTDSNTVINYDVLNSQNTPPGSPATGDIYLVGNSPSGAWVGHAKDIAEWNGSAWVFTDGVQGDFLYNATNALTYIFRSGNWVQTTGIPALNNGNTISSGLTIGTNNARSLNFETNNINRGRFDSIGRFHIYNLPTSSTGDTFVTLVNTLGKFTKQGKSTFLAGVGGGGSALSSITAATATNTINNANYGQEWQWNSLTSGTGLKLSSTSTSATTGNTLLELNSSGTIGNYVSSYGLKVANSKVSPSGRNYGIDINVGGSSDVIGLNITATSGAKGTGINLEAGMTEGIQLNGNILYFDGSNTRAIQYTGGVLQISSGSSQTFNINSGTTGRWAWFGNGGSYNNYTTLNRHTSNGTMLIFGGEWDGTTTISNTATPSLIKASSGGLTFSSNSGASTTWGSFTPNNQMTIYNVNNNVGIGTTTPVASAILDLTSTTKGFAPPEMTATQASAISTTSRKLIIYVTDTNGTFTSAGLWMWNGTTWKLILAE